MVLLHAILLPVPVLIGLDWIGLDLCACLVCLIAASLSLEATSFYLTTSRRPATHARPERLCLGISHKAVRTTAAL